MLAAFKDYIKETGLFNKNDKILLAISGGVDSMVMGQLFHDAGFNFGVAHCNFQLRGAESDKDAELVQTIAEKWEVPFHTTQFDTTAEGEKQKKSTELIARELRYQWFGELLQEHDYQYVATAHHLNDSLETLLYNLAKGTGIRGLHGIPVKNGRTIRPLSFMSRKEILTFAADYRVTYREDASNKSLEHSRNLIRHQVVPPLKEINPSLESTFARTLKQLKETESLFLWAVNEQKKALLLEEEGILKIEVNALKKAISKTTVLYEIIQSYGFNSDHADQILRAIDNVGAQFYSKSHLITVGRKSIAIQQKTNSPNVSVEIKGLPSTVSLPKGALIASILTDQPTNLNQGKATAFFDLAKMELPFIIRKWKEGDRFQPLGMEGKSKKVKDLLRDEKVPVFEKDAVLVLETGGEIAWVVGYRADERFKVVDATKEVLKLSQ